MAAFFRDLLRDRGRRRLALTAAVLAVAMILGTGIFSYLSGRDTVTNRLTGKNGSVTLLEPAWDQEGQYLAAAAEPGMMIPKNPYGYNDGQADLYVRLEVTVELEDFDSTGKTDAYNAHYNANVTDRDRRRLLSIVNAIRFDSDGEGHLVPFLTLKNTGDDVSDWAIDACANGSFAFDEENQSETDDKLVFYFYFTGGDTDGEDALLRVVRPGAPTAELFHSVEIPVYKPDYLGVFDQPYKITVVARGLPAGAYPDGLTVTDAAGAFSTAE